MPAALCGHGRWEGLLLPDGSPAGFAHEGECVTAVLQGQAVLTLFGTIGDPASALSAGTNALLRLGATPVTRVDDVLELFALEPAGRSRGRLSAGAEAALHVLRDGSLTADEVVRAAGLSPPEGSAVLMELELSGAVALEDGVYRATV